MIGWLEKIAEIRYRSASDADGWSSGAGFNSWNE